MQQADMQQVTPPKSDSGRNGIPQVLVHRPHRDHLDLLSVTRCPLYVMTLRLWCAFVLVDETVSRHTLIVIFAFECTP